MFYNPKEDITANKKKMCNECYKILCMKKFENNDEITIMYLANMEEQI